MFLDNYLITVKKIFVLPKCDTNIFVSTSAVAFVNSGNRNEDIKVEV